MENETMAKEESLSVTHPELAAKWHPTLNGDLTFDMVTESLRKRVFWVCPDCGKAYRRMPWLEVALQDKRCQDCRPQETRDHSLAANIPELAAEWHPTKNGDLTPKSVSLCDHKVVWWRCEKGHEWRAQVNSRLRDHWKDLGCPYCTGRKLWPGFNDLATTHPLLAKEWHPTKNGDLTPQMIMANSHRRVWWKGPCGHEWEATVSDRKEGQTCLVCTNKQLCVGYNDLATKYPELAAKWHPTKNGDLKPQDVLFNSQQKVWWTDIRSKDRVSERVSMWGVFHKEKGKRLHKMRYPKRVGTI